MLELNGLLLLLLVTKIEGCSGPPIAWGPISLYDY